MNENNNYTLDNTIILAEKKIATILLGRYEFIYKNIHIRN